MAFHPVFTFPFLIKKVICLSFKSISQSNIHIKGMRIPYLCNMCYQRVYCNNKKEEKKTGPYQIRSLPRPILISLSKAFTGLSVLQIVPVNCYITNKISYLLVKIPWKSLMWIDKMSILCVIAARNYFLFTKIIKLDKAQFEKSRIVIT